MDFVRLSCPRHATTATAIVHLVPYRPNGLCDPWCGGISVKLFPEQKCENQVKFSFASFFPTWKKFKINKNVLKIPKISLFQINLSHNVSCGDSFFAFLLNHFYLIHVPLVQPVRISPKPHQLNISIVSLVIETARKNTEFTSLLWIKNCHSPKLITN